MRKFLSRNCSSRWRFRWSITNNYLTEFRADDSSLLYVSGYAAFKMKSKLPCSICALLITNDEESDNKYFNAYQLKDQLTIRLTKTLTLQQMLHPLQTLHYLPKYLSLMLQLLCHIRLCSVLQPSLLNLPLSSLHSTRQPLEVVQRMRVLRIQKMIFLMKSHRHHSKRLSFHPTVPKRKTFNEERHWIIRELLCPSRYFKRENLKISKTKRNA